jgi:hypothetical protein|tara:strand:- start:9 stop:146 length:138 start_codon:yes stop_codon:yes gene_type:complete
MESAREDRARDLAIRRKQKLLEINSTDTAELSLKSAIKEKRNKGK